MANDYAGEFKSMAERAAETSLRNTAGMLGLPVYHVHRNLDEKQLRLLCISVAQEALAIYTKWQYETSKARQDANVVEAEHDPELAHPGC
jgi:hypothetical protein